MPSNAVSRWRSIRSGGGGGPRRRRRRHTGRRRAVETDRNSLFSVLNYLIRPFTRLRIISAALMRRLKKEAELHTRVCESECVCSDLDLRRYRPLQRHVLFSPQSTEGAVLSVHGHGTKTQPNVPGWFYRLIPGRKEARRPLCHILSTAERAGRALRSGAVRA